VTKIRNRVTREYVLYILEGTATLHSIVTPKWQPSVSQQIGVSISSIRHAIL